jgi:hypothetical protein
VRAALIYDVDLGVVAKDGCHRGDGGVHACLFVQEGGRVSLPERQVCARIGLEAAQRVRREVEGAKHAGEGRAVCKLPDDRIA